MSSKTWIRVALALFGVELNAQAAWILLAQTYPQNHIQLPVDENAPIIAHIERDKIKQAASVAEVRGELWADSAFTYASQLWNDPAMALDADDRIDGEVLPDPGAEILTASWRCLAHVCRPGRSMQMDKISTGLVA
jgi:hypothetical protein